MVFSFRRPIYEAVLISFIILLIITRSITQVGTYIDVALNTPLLYSMTAFITMSIILTKTKIIDSAIAVILSLLGRISEVRVMSLLSPVLLWDPCPVLDLVMLWLPDQSLFLL